MEWQNKKV